MCWPKPSTNLLARSSSSIPRGFGASAATGATCGDVRTLAIEPQPGIVERLRFHLAANRSAKIDALPIALSDHGGEAVLVINDSDSGGTHIDKQD